MKFREPEKLKVHKEAKVNVSTRVRPEVRRKLELAATRTPQKLPLAAFVEQILEDYVNYLESKGTI